ncbi:MAG: hypothetical protein HY452_01290, partial [Parcubacteria group bacterium]|nr:hypothetical protein [Parcubacteria group bacterium]
MIKLKKLRPILVFWALAAAPLFAFADQLDDLRTEKAGLQSEIDVLEAKINEYQKELGNKREEINTLKNEITRINTQISKLNLEIKKTENQIYLTRINIQETETDIHETELSIVEKREVLAGLLREFRKFDEETLLERALKYDTLTEVVKQTEYLNSLQLKLNDVLSATKTLKNNLENKEVVLK